MQDIILVKHATGAPGMRLFGLGPNLLPKNSLEKLIRLLDNNSPWAKDRSKNKLKKMLSKSSVVVSIWNKNKLIGFGRATTDEVFRAVLWDIIVDKDFQRRGLGKKIVSSIINDLKLKKTEKIYIMTTNCEEFYLEMGFIKEENQALMQLKKRK